MRHAIQKAGHECLPLLFMLVACGTGVLFYLGNFWPGSPPGWVVVPVLVTLAICTEWLTFTFNQDMQDACTVRRGRGFPVVRAAAHGCWLHSQGMRTEARIGNRFAVRGQPCRSASLIDA